MVTVLMLDFVNPEIPLICENPMVLSIRVSSVRVLPDTSWLMLSKLISPEKLLRVTLFFSSTLWNCWSPTVIIFPDNWDSPLTEIEPIPLRAEPILFALKLP